MVHASTFLELGQRGGIEPEELFKINVYRRPTAYGHGTL